MDEYNTKIYPDVKDYKFLDYTNMESYKTGDNILLIPSGDLAYQQIKLYSPAMRALAYLQEQFKEGEKEVPLEHIINSVPMRISSSIRDINNKEQIMKMNLEVLANYGLISTSRNNLTIIPGKQYNKAKIYQIEGNIQKNTPPENDKEAS